MALLFLAVWHGFHPGYYLTFASEFLVAPNLPDFTVWASPGDLLRNPAVAAFCLAVLLLYVILAIWARRKDKNDHGLPLP